MIKIRVHELAKEFGFSAKDMENKLKEWGYNIKNYSSSLEEHEVKEIRLRFREEKSSEPLAVVSPVSQTVRRRPAVVRLRKVSAEAEGEGHQHEAAVVEEKTKEMPDEKAIEIKEEKIEAQPFVEVQPTIEAQPAVEAHPKSESQPLKAEDVEKVSDRKKKKTTLHTARIITKPEPLPEPVKFEGAKPEPVATTEAPQDKVELTPESAEAVSSKVVSHDEKVNEAPTDVVSKDLSSAQAIFVESVSKETVGEVEETQQADIAINREKEVVVEQKAPEKVKAEKTEVITSDWSKKGTKDLSKGKPPQKGQARRGPHGNERAGGASAQPSAEPKSFVKILDRPRIILPSMQPQAQATRQARSSGTGGQQSHQQTRQASGGAARSQDVSRQRQPSAAIEITPPAAPFLSDAERKAKKIVKDKRVVQVSEMEEAAKRKKAAKKSEKLRPLTKLLTEELEPDLLETHTEETVEVAVRPVSSSKPSYQKKKTQKQVAKPVEPVQPAKIGKKKLTVFETIQVGDLSHKMGVKVGEVITKLMKMGVMATVNQPLDFDTASIIASEFGCEVEKKQAIEEQLLAEEVKTGELVLRPPVVTVMGHVDHGKTSLLDAIRDTDVVAREAGGITQHIGAYHVKLASGHEVVFLDTPGHAAFTAMRARGAKVTDIVILVVAADDGVMAQTREAIDHSKAAGVPIIVAVNKIDKPEANPDRVKRELADLGLIPEEWGGTTIFVSIAAKKRIGVEELVEMLALQADVMELKADPVRPAKGYVIEAKLDKGRGPVATLLVSDGTLRPGDIVVCGLHYGKVRAMINDKGGQVQSAGPSMPVEILGLSGVPEAGNEFFVVADEKKAREVAEYRQRKQREAELVSQKKMGLADVFERIKEQELKELNIILKTDVQGSLEALSESLKKLSTAEVRVNIAGSGIGAINESDVLLASATNAIVIGFNVKPNNQARALAEQEKIDIHFYDIIYNALDEVRAAMTGLLEPVFKEKELGRAEVRDTFHIPKVGTVAGCGVIEGFIQRNALVRILRDNVVVHTGKMASLRRFKEDVKEVQRGYECGIGIERFNDIKVGDVIEAYVMEETAATLGAEVTSS